jgi:hypothetical protein
MNPMRSIFSSIKLGLYEIQNGLDGILRSLSDLGNFYRDRIY